MEGLEVEDVDVDEVDVVRGAGRSWCVLSWSPLVLPVVLIGLVEFDVVRDAGGSLCISSWSP